MEGTPHEVSPRETTGAASPSRGSRADTPCGSRRAARPRAGRRPRGCAWRRGWTPRDERRPSPASSQTGGPGCAARCWSSHCSYASGSKRRAAWRSGAFAVASQVAESGRKVACVRRGSKAGSPSADTAGTSCWGSHTVPTSVNARRVLLPARRTGVPDGDSEPPRGTPAPPKDPRRIGGRGRHEPGSGRRPDGQADLKEGRQFRIDLSFLLRLSVDQNRRDDPPALRVRRLQVEVELGHALALSLDPGREGRRGRTPVTQCDAYRLQDEQVVRAFPAFRLAALILGRQLAGRGFPEPGVGSAPDLDLDRRPGTLPGDREREPWQRTVAAPRRASARRSGSRSALVFLVGRSGEFLVLLLGEGRSRREEDAGQVTVTGCADRISSGLTGPSRSMASRSRSSSRLISCPQRPRADTPGTNLASR